MRRETKMYFASFGKTLFSKANTGQCQRYNEYERLPMNMANGLVRRILSVLLDWLANLIKKAVDKTATIVAGAR